MKLMFASDIHGSLPATEQRLFITHGHLYNPKKLPPLASHDTFIFGHTHLPLAEKREGIYLFNPGSVSIPKGGFAASYGMLNDGVLSIHALNNDGVIAQVDITP